MYLDLPSSPQDHLPDNSLDDRVTRPRAVTLINQLVVSAATIQVLVLICRLGRSSHTDASAVFQLLSSVAHGLGPDVVSFLSRDDFGIVQESGSRILTFILDRAIVSAVEVGILKC